MFKLKEIQTFVCSVLRHNRCLKFGQKCPDFRLKTNFCLDFRCLKSELFGNQTVIECLKSMTVWILDPKCMFDEAISYEQFNMID